MNLKYQFDNGFNVFSKIGAAWSQTSEKLTFEELNKRGSNWEVGNRRDIDNIKSSSISPKIGVGFGYEVKDILNFSLHYSYLHGINKISPIHSIGILIEYRLVTF